ncbi:S-layer homology domain-containing protein [Citricoccus sp. SGAir0253]|uniref:S-layer homology domain-containing protein n=1 Tax=Citricoccus sp. SGAir0253 TaxID=2567881 RepID=UPI0010CCF978|nr:S-layer homology domain-containing protein [Citricoccus sp. SGAir0253]QCU78471.1 S-layer homology domain-containing protein [Citricoccus sp. SGAir0253]
MMTRTLIPRALAATAALALALPVHAVAAAPAHATVTIPDPDFRACLNAALGRSPADPVSAGQLAGLRSLECPTGGPGAVDDLTGAQYLTGLASLRVAGHRVGDVSALAGLERLADVDLSSNAITDASALAPLAARGARIRLAGQSTAATVPVGEGRVLPAARDSRGVPVPYDDCHADDYADVPVDCADGLRVEADGTVFTPAAPGYHAVSASGRGLDHFSLTVEVTADPVQWFTDVPVGRAFAREVSWMAVRGIARGYADGRFGIAEEVTRGHAAAFLYRLAGEPPVDLPATSPFPDVPRGHGFYAAVVWLRGQGIARGHEDGTFGLDRAVTRGEMAALLHRSVGSPTDPPPPARSPFWDVPPSHGSYRPITWLNAAGVVRGHADGGFGPDDAVTRGQAAALLYRLKHRPGA